MKSGGGNLYAFCLNTPTLNIDPDGSASQADDLNTLRRLATDWRSQGYVFAANLLTQFYTQRGAYVPSQRDTDEIKNSSEYRNEAQKYFGRRASTLCAQGVGGKFPIADGKSHGPYAFNVYYTSGDLFRALGGAHFYYTGSMTLCCGENMWHVVITMSQEDDYTYTPLGFLGYRRLSSDYMAANELETKYGFKPFVHTETWVDKFVSKE